LLDSEAQKGGLGERPGGGNRGGVPFNMVLWGNGGEKNPWGGQGKKPDKQKNAKGREKNTEEYRKKGGENGGESGMQNHTKSSGVNGRVGK